MITTADYYIIKTMTNRTCHLTMGQETMPFIHLFMAVPKKSPYVMELNKEYKYFCVFGQLLSKSNFLFCFIDRIGGTRWVCIDIG